MDIYALPSMKDRIFGNSYVGRGIVLGKTPDETCAVSAYFIMGRSANSRNRVFVKCGDDVLINAYDPSKLADPTLIIYAPLRQFQNHLIVTNGDQTDTIYNSLRDGGSFESALDKRAFEPDGPNWTPRISGMISFAKNGFSYKMSILKSADAAGTACNRFTYSYAALPGVGHFLHTYICDGNPIPTFQGEPERVAIPDDIDAFTDEIWNHLDYDNRISLYVRYTSLSDGTYQDRLINRYQ